MIRRPILAAVLAFGLAACPAYHPVKRISLALGEGTNRIGVVLDGQGETSAATVVRIRNGSVWVAEPETAVLKVFDARGVFRRMLRLSVAGRAPEVEDLLVTPDSRLYVFERIFALSGPESNAAPVESVLLHEFSPGGAYLRTLASFAGLLRGNSINSFGQITVAVQDPGGDWVVRRFIGGVPVKTIRFTNSVAPDGTGTAINNVRPFLNDNNLLVERIRLPTNETDPGSYSVYDLTTGRETPVQPVKARLLRGGFFLFTADRNGRAYFMKRSGRARVTVLSAPVFPRTVSGGPLAKQWDLSYRNRDGLLLEPVIDDDGNLRQLRLGRTSLNLVLYR